MKTSMFRSYLVVLFMYPVVIFGQNDQWEWTKAFGGPGSDEIYSAEIDNTGNLYVAGYFQRKIDIDGVLLESKGDNDILIAKFNSRGNLVWVKQAGGTYSENMIITEYARKIKVDDQGNVIVAGCFTWQAEFDGNLLKGPGNIDIFIAKYSPEGALIWVKSYGSQQSDYLFDMDVFGENIYFTGNATGSFITESSNTNYKDSENSVSGTTPFIACLDSNGSLNWIRRDEGQADKTLLRVVNGKIYYAVEFSSDMVISDIEYKVARNRDFVVQCFTHEGEIEWQKKFSSEANETIESLESDYKGSVLISGKYGNIPELKLLEKKTDDIKKSTFFSKLSGDGSISVTANNESPAFRGGTMFSLFPENKYFSTDVFSTPIVINDSLLLPDGIWFNSYVAMHDYHGNMKELLFKTPGIIKALMPINKSEFYVSGNYLSSTQEPYTKNSSGGGIDIFIGLRKTSNDKETEAKEAINSQSEMRLAPNPAEKSCTLSVGNLKEAANLIITNAEGKIVLHFEAVQLPFNLVLEEFAQGVYSVSLKTGDVMVSKKLVVIKEEGSGTGH